MPVWSEMLRFAGSVLADPQMVAALDHPQLTPRDKEALLLSVLGDKLNREGRSFVRVLIEADRIALLPAIAHLFEKLKDASDGVAKATIETAFPMDDTQLKDLTLALERRFGQKIETTVAVKPELIGGARVTVGDTFLGGSVQEQLRA
ncbi:MAG: F0F1 ATP synthase subunit delta, partial [Casimicrobiaceae bacterium]